MSDRTEMSRRSALRLGAGALAGTWLLGGQPATAATSPTASEPTRGRGFPVRGPVILTTAAMIERARRRVGERRQPFFRSWLAIKKRADQALTKEFVPYNGGSHRTYWLTAKPQAQDARALALAFQITGEQRYADKATSILRAWAADAERNPNPAGDRLPPAGSPQGLVIGRVMVIFADAYSLVYDALDEAGKAAVNHWHELMVTPILNSQRFWVEGENLDAGLTAPYLEQQYFNNHLGAQTMGLAAIGFVLDDQKLIQYALKSPHNPRDLETLIDGAILMPEDIGSGVPGDLWYRDPTVTDGAPAPQPGEIFDRYRILIDQGIGYSLLHLRVLTTMAEMAYNNGQGRDYFRYVGPHGENLELSWEFYAAFLITGDSSAHTGYYTGSSIGYGHVAMYEIAHRHYPNNPKIREVLEVNDRVVNDGETFGRSAPLTHGLVLD